MGVQRFFFTLFPVSSEDEFLEEVFALTYSIKGITWEACLDMRVPERQWMLRRLHKQQKAENAAVRKAGRKK